MKEHITPAEENLKADFTQYEAPLDLAAFDQFKKALDKPDNTRRNRIIVTSIIIPVFIFIGITIGDFLVPSEDIGINLESIDQEISSGSLVKKDNHSQINQSQDQIDLNQIENTLKGLQTIAIEPSELQKSTTKTIGKNSFGFSDLVSNQSNADFTHKEDEHKLTNLPPLTLNNTLAALQRDGHLITKRNINTNSENKQIKSSNIGMTTVSDIENQAQSNNNIPRTKIAISEKAENNLTEIKTLDFIPNLASEFLSTQSKVGDFDIPLSELNYYQPHFYFRFDLGYTQARDFGSEDMFLKAHNRFGSQAKGIVGFQFSQRSAIEFGYQQRQVSSSWEFKTFFANSQSFVNTHLLSVAIQNSLPILKSRWSLTHKVGYLFGFGNLKSNDLNESGDFIVSQLLNTAFRYKEDFFGIESNKYHLLTGGVGVSYQLSYNFEIGINANYNFGLKPIRKSNVDYIYGEGLEGNYQGETRGTFVSMNFNVLYRIRS